MRKEFIGRVKYKLEIMIKAVIFNFVYSISGIFKNKKKYEDLWVVSERGDDAGDNGFALFCYIRKMYPERNVKYIIKKGVADAEKVKKVGKIIAYGSFEHYLSIILAEVLISTHLLGYTTNDYLFQRYERKGMLKGKRVFLQHGVTKDDVHQFYRDEAIPDLFICAVEQEADYVRKTFHQPDSVVRLAGFCRYDALPLEASAECKRKILLMPTWRSDLFFYSKRDFKKSLYYKNWQKLLSSKKLRVLLEKYDFNLIFYPHHQMQKFVELFVAESEKIIIASSRSYEVQKLLIDTDILVTDFSSVFFDYAYMRKPMIFFQFDKQEYRKTNYQKGWFSYERDGFGKVLEDADDVVKELEMILSHDCVMDPLYLQRLNKLFTYHDHHNCERNYKAILEKVEDC